MEYALAHKSVWDEVDYYLPPDDTLCKAFQNTLRLRLLGFVNGLNKEYDDIRRRALHRKDGLPMIDMLVKELQEEESHFHLHGVPSLEASRDSMALLTRPPPPASPTESTPTDMVCSYCSRPGHLRNQCRKRWFDNKKKVKKEATTMVALSAQSTSTARSSAVTVEQLQADLARLSAQMTAVQAPSTTSFFGAFSSLAPDEWYCGHTALTSPLVSDTTWVLDSEATEHMTSLNNRFVSYQRHVGGCTILTAGGGRLPVTGIGAVSVDGLGVVHNVLHVPSLRAILLSPQRLVDAVLCSFHLQPNGMFLSDKVGRTTPIRREHGLLLLDDGGRSQCFMMQRNLRAADEQ